MLTIRKRTKKEKKGFGKPDLPSNWRYVEIELNQEEFEGNNLDESDIIDVKELHILGIAPVTSKTDLFCIETWINQIAPVYISPAEFLAEMYVIKINSYALSIGANVGRIKHIKRPGDNHLRLNSIGHLFEPETPGLTTPKQISDVVDKYVNVLEIVPGEFVTLRTRSLKYAEA